MMAGPNTFLYRAHAYQLEENGAVSSFDQSVSDEAMFMEQPLRITQDKVDLDL
jgi:hypothetical protein